MLVYVLTIVAGLVVAVGEVVQQRTAATAPPQDNLSIRLLWYLVRQPRWLFGIVFSTAGNSLFAAAVGFGNLVVVEAVFVVRLLFALVIAAVWRRYRIPLRDGLGAAAITVGLVAFLLAAQPHRNENTAVPALHWALGGGVIVALALVAAVVAARSAPARKAAVLGAAAGAIFGLQASLTQSAVRTIRTDGLLGLVTTWHGYAVVVVALFGMLLVQSAFEAAPLSASYPAVVTCELIAGIAVGIAVLGGTIALAPAAITVGIVSLLVMIVGIYLLTTSPVVTGQLDVLARNQDLGAATRLEERLDRELAWAESALQGQHATSGSDVQQRVRHLEDGIGRLGELQDDIRRERHAQAARSDADEEVLAERERAVEEHAARLRLHVDRLGSTDGS